MPRQRSITTTVTIPAPREFVWALLSDTTRYAEWVYATLEVTNTDGLAELDKTYEPHRRTGRGPYALAGDRVRAAAPAAPRRRRVVRRQRAKHTT